MHWVCGGGVFQVVSGQEGEGLGLQFRDREAGFQKYPLGSRDEEVGSL